MLLATSESRFVVHANEECDVSEFQDWKFEYVHRSQASNKLSSTARKNASEHNHHFHLEDVKHTCVLVSFADSARNWHAQSLFS